MADEYIGHNTSGKELSDGANYFGYHADVTLTDPTAQDYISLCNLLGVEKLGTPVNVIFRDNKCYIKGPLTVTFKKEVQKLHIKTRSDNDIRPENTLISSYTFESTNEENAIKEFNFTTRLKKEGYGYDDKKGNEDFPLMKTWNSYSKKSIEERGSTIQENYKDTDQNVLFPFNGIKQCFIPNYFNSDDGASGSINGAVFDGSILDPLPYPIGQPKNADFTEYYPGFGFSSDVTINCNGGQAQTLEAKNDCSKMGNMCLYPLVLMDETSKKHPNMRIVLKKENGKDTIQVYDGITPITKPIEVDLEKDFLVAYTQERKPLTFEVSVLNGDGVQWCNPRISREQTCVLGEREPPRKDGTDGNYHFFVDAEMFLKLDAKQEMGDLVTKIFLGEDEDFNAEQDILQQKYYFGYLGGGSKWKEIQEDQSYSRFIELFNCIKNNLTMSVNKASDVQSGKRSIVGEGKQKAYNAQSLTSAETIEMDRYSVGDNSSSKTQTVPIEVSTCCQDDCCGDAVLEVQASACVAATSFTMNNKRQGSNSKDYVKYIEHGFKGKESYGLNNNKVDYTFPSLKEQPYIYKIGSLKVTQNGPESGKAEIFDSKINFYLNDFSGYIRSSGDYDIYQKGNGYVNLGLNNLKGKVNFTFDNFDIDIKDENGNQETTKGVEDKVIVLWTHKLPDGNLAA